MRIASALAIAGVLTWPIPIASTASVMPACRAAAQPLRTLPGRVDVLLAASPTGAVMALVGRLGSRVPYLPHDTLTIVHTGRPASTASTIPLAPYLTAPGLAATVDGKRLYVLADSTLIVLDGLTGQVTARLDLAMQAIGWPAAITVGPRGTVYLIGQPAGALVAQVNAFAPDSRGVLWPRWRTPLGVTHAGTWIGLAGARTLAVYIPDQHDVHGTVALLDSDDGAMLHSYALPVPPVADDATRDRIYLADAGTIRAYGLSTGIPVAVARGTLPLAVNARAGLVAFIRGDRMVLAEAGNLRVVWQLPLPGGTPPTALAWQGSNLLMGKDHGISRMGLDACT